MKAGMCIKVIKIPPAALSVHGVLQGSTTLARVRRTFCLATCKSEGISLCGEVVEGKPDFQKPVRRPQDSITLAISDFCGVGTHALNSPGGLQQCVEASVLSFRSAGHAAKIKNPPVDWELKCLSEAKEHMGMDSNHLISNSICHRGFTASDCRSHMSRLPVSGDRYQ